MRLPFDAVTVFAEDVREEKQGTISLIGILPDILAIPNMPSALPKIAIYTRIHVPVESAIDGFTVLLRMLDGKRSISGNSLRNFSLKLGRRPKLKGIHSTGW